MAERSAAARDTTHLDVTQKPSSRSNAVRDDRAAADNAQEQDDVGGRRERMSRATIERPRLTVRPPLGTIR